MMAPEDIAKLKALAPNLQAWKQQIEARNVQTFQHQTSKH